MKIQDILGDARDCVNCAALAQEDDPNSAGTVLNIAASKIEEANRLLQEFREGKPEEDAP
jgi:hypothetical protein